MATYAELHKLSSNGDLITKIRVACIIAAELIRLEPTSVVNHASRAVWAKSVFENPIREAERMVWAVLAQNRTFTVAQILAANDAAIQTAVNDAVNVFAS